MNALSKIKRFFSYLAEPVRVDKAAPGAMVAVAIGMSLGWMIPFGIWLFGG